MHRSTVLIPEWVNEYLNRSVSPQKKGEFIRKAVYQAIIDTPVYMLECEDTLEFWARKVSDGEK